MSLFGSLGTALGGLVGGPAGAAVGGGLGSVVGGLFGGGGDSGGGGGGDSGGGGYSYDPAAYVQYASQAAAANSPLTAAMQGLAILQGSLAGALGQQGEGISTGQKTVLADAANQAKTATSAQASEVARLLSAGTNLQYLLGQGRIQSELLGPQFTAQAGSAALAGENKLMQDLFTTNAQLKGLQEQAKANVAADQAQTFGDIFQTRANTEGQLALGAQALESGLKLQQAKTLSDLQTIKGQTKARLAEKRYGAGQALAGTRYFA